MPKNLNNAKVTQRLVEAFQLKGRYIPMLDEMITPVYVIDDPAPAEANRLAVGTVQIQAAVNPTTQLFNPLESGIVAVVTFANAIFSKPSGAASLIDITVFLVESDQVPSDASFALNREWRDTRIDIADPYAFTASKAGSVAAGAVIIQNATSIESGVGTATVGVLETPVQGPRQPPVVLKPGTGVAINANTGVDNINMSSNFLWEEIPIMGRQVPASGTPP